jgi:RNA polymerase primary sigma factor
VLVDDLARAIRDRPGSTAPDLVRVLTSGGTAIDEEAVTRALYAAHGRFRAEGRHPARWRLAGEPHPTASAPASAPAPAPAAPGVSAPRGEVAPGAPGLSLWRWQGDALAAWARQGDRGVVEAVTGAGKTMVGVAAVLDQRRVRGQALVLVPTKELQHQWLSALRRWCGPSTRVGALGDGGRASLASHDVVVAVVNSVRAGDARPTRPRGLLVADECHRYASQTNRQALDPRMTRRLGLSATYARDDDGHRTWLDPYFGGACFRLGYPEAVAGGVVARPAVALVGVRLDPVERGAYEDLSEIMRRAAASLVKRHGVTRQPYAAFVREVNALADRSGDGEATLQARRYRHAVLERRRLLADATGKRERLAELVPAVRAAERTIVFTQTIKASEAAAALLTAGGVPAGAVHSGLAAGDRRGVLERFARGDIRAVSAPRVLDEGVDVPAADLAVILGASRTRRQMVQRMGRVLRLKADGRLARFAVLFAEGTVEDPQHGAHEGFVAEVTSIAAAVTRFPAATPAGAVNEFLRALGTPGPAR